MSPDWKSSIHSRSRRAHERGKSRRALKVATLRAACRFDRLPFDFAQSLSLSNGQGPELAEGRLATSLRSLPRAKTVLPKS